MRFPSLPTVPYGADRQLLPLCATSAQQSVVPRPGCRHVAAAAFAETCSDPSSPVLVSTFNTVCSADPIDAICDPDTLATGDGAA